MHLSSYIWDRHSVSEVAERIRPGLRLVIACPLEQRAVAAEQRGSRAYVAHRKSRRGFRYCLRSLRFKAAEANITAGLAVDGNHNAADAGFTSRQGPGPHAETRITQDGGGVRGCWHQV